MGMLYDLDGIAVTLEELIESKGPAYNPKDLVVVDADVIAACCYSAARGGRQCNHRF
jgi:hypothetical protein